MTGTYPWRDGRTGTDVVQANRDLLVRIGMIKRGRGYSVTAMKEIERRLGRELPADVKELYAAARPKHPTSEDFADIALFAPDSEEEVRWYKLLEDEPHPIDLIKHGEPIGLNDFKNAEGFMIGGTPYFDRLFCVKGHARLPDGCIVLTDHEDDYALPVAARSLAEYLARICFFGGVDLLAYPGDRDNHAVEKVALLAREFAELNPSGSEWWESAFGLSDEESDA